MRINHPYGRYLPQNGGLYDKDKLDYAESLRAVYEGYKANKSRHQIEMESMLSRHQMVSRIKRLCEIGLLKRKEGSKSYMITDKRP